MIITVNAEEEENKSVGRKRCHQNERQVDDFSSTNGSDLEMEESFGDFHRLNQSLVPQTKKPRPVETIDAEL